MMNEDQVGVAVGSHRNRRPHLDGSTQCSLAVHDGMFATQNHFAWTSVGDHINKFKKYLTSKSNQISRILITLDISIK